MNRTVVGGFPPNRGFVYSFGLSNHHRRWKKKKKNNNNNNKLKLHNFQLLSPIIKILADRRPAIVIHYNLRMCILLKNTGGVSL